MTKYSTCRNDSYFDEMYEDVLEYIADNMAAGVEMSEILETVKGA